ncbi:MAG: hypothetical protein ACI4NA_05000, partial [Succinivibrio sp.]
WCFGLANCSVRKSISVPNEAVMPARWWKEAPQGTGPEAALKTAAPLAGLHRHLSKKHGNAVLF